jgi:TMEM175 potassium channel family protein
MTTEPKSVRQLIHSVLLSKGRMEALTDGIFAIAMTLLVLELKVPDLPKSVASHELLQKLGEETPAFVSFLISFMYCGLLWLQHHLAMHFVRHIQAALVWLNLLFLMSISILPFSCALLGHFIRNSAVQEIYFGNMLLAALLLLMQWLFAKRKKLLHEDDPRATKAMGQQLFMLPVALAAGMLAAPYRPLAGFYGMTLALLAMRAWQRQAFRKEARISRAS